MLTLQQSAYVRKLFKNEPVDAVYLFGSQATGEANKNSDYDFAIIFKKNISQSERFDARERYIGKLDAFFGDRKSEVVDFEELPIRYRHNVIIPKKDIYNVNHGRVVDLEVDTTRQYLDMKPYLNYISKRQLELIAQKGILQ